MGDDVSPDVELDVIDSYRNKTKVVGGILNRRSGWFSMKASVVADVEQAHSSAIVIVVGSVNTDMVIKSNRLPAPGETVLGGQFFRFSGGKGANQAVAAARLSAKPVKFVAAIGDDEAGQSSLKTFQQENLDLQYLHTIPDTASGIALILVDEGGENLISVASGANSKLAPDHIKAIDDNCFRSAATFLTCLESPLETVVAGLKRAKSLGLTTILNPAPASEALYSHDVLQWVDILTPNAGEIELMTGQTVATEEDAINIASQMAELGCRKLIVTRGKDGLWIVDDGTLTVVPARNVSPVDTTAAGDAFNGALAVAIAEGMSLLPACQFANMAASLSVTRSGAQPSLATRAEVEELLNSPT